MGNEVSSSCCNADGSASLPVHVLRRAEALDEPQRLDTEPSSGAAKAGRPESAREQRPEPTLKPQAEHRHPQQRPQHQQPVKKSLPDPAIVAAARRKVAKEADARQRQSANRARRRWCSGRQTDRQADRQADKPWRDTFMTSA